MLDDGDDRGGLPVKTASDIQSLVASLKHHGVEGAQIALVLGSGLGVLAERITKAKAISYADIEGLPRSSVPGHAGKLIVGELNGVRVVAQQGRVHLYEGWSVFEITRAVRAFAGLGVGKIVLTNAAGGIARRFRPGTLMRITDHLNLQGRTPLENHQGGAGAPWDAGLGAALDRGAARAGVQLESGVYAGLLGPTYETPSEIRMLEWMGADAVGMSTVAEALAAHAAGMRVAGISCITNLAAGISAGPLSHDEVIEVGKQASTAFCSLLEHSMPELERA